jgi:hypothetical protein
MAARHTLKPSDLEGFFLLSPNRTEPDAALLAGEALALYRENPAGPFPPAAPLYIKSETFRTWSR